MIAENLGLPLGKLRRGIFGDFFPVLSAAEINVECEKREDGKQFGLEGSERV